MKKSLLLEFSQYVSLSIFGMIGLSCYILADTFFVSKGLGINGLSALNLAISVYSIIHGIGLMLAIGGSTKFTTLRSKGEHYKANYYFSTTVILTLIVSAVFVVIGVFFSKDISSLLGADHNTLPLTNTYLLTIMCFSPFFTMNNVLIAFVRNDNNPRLSMIAMLTGSLSNIILDYIFIFPLNMGMFGAAFATGLSPVISIFILSFHFITKRNTFFFAKCKLHLRRILNICSLGLSSLITEISSAIVLIVFNLIILRIAGNVGLAAYGIVANVSLVAVSIFVAISQGMQPLVSRRYGEGNKSDLRQLLKYGIGLTITLTVIIYTGTYLFTNSIVEIFNSENNKQLADIAAIGLRIYFIGFFFAGINIVMSGYLAASNNPKKSFIISVLRAIVIIIPLAFLMSALLGMTGVWLSFPIAELLTMIVALWAIGHR